MCSSDEKYSMHQLLDFLPNYRYCSIYISVYLKDLYHKQNQHFVDNIQHQYRSIILHHHQQKVVQSL